MWGLTVPSKRDALALRTQSHDGVERIVPRSALPEFGTAQPAAPVADTPAAPWVRIAIVTFDSGGFTQSCLDALAAQTFGAFEAVIWDNASTDGSLDALILPDARFRLVRHADNLGFAGGSNAALQGARTPYVMTLNPDTVLAPDCLAELHGAALLGKAPAMLSPVLFKADGTADGAGDTLGVFGLAWRNGYGRSLELSALPQIAQVFGPTGAAALYRRDAFEAEGGFEPSFFCYFEDVDLALRLRARGGEAWLVKAATGRHSGGHTVGGRPEFPVYHTARNAPNAIMRSAPLLLAPLMLLLHVMAHAWLQFRQRGQAVAEARRQGFRDGMKRLPRSLADRFRRRPYPLGASWRVARRLSWRRRDVSRQPLRWWPVRSERAVVDGTALDREDGAG